MPQSELPSHPKIYDSIGSDYRQLRVPDHRIAAQLKLALGNAITICNVGAGAGSYEPDDRKVVAVEPSETMIAQRSDQFPVVRAVAEDLPFSDHQFDAAMAILTIHHWTDAARGLQEMARVSKRQVVLTFDPLLVDSFWLVKDYIPEIVEFDQRRGVAMQTVSDHLQVVEKQVVPIPWDCTDGFQAAYWRRPERYLDPVIRSAISTFAQLPEKYVNRGINQLANDLESGKWKEKNQGLLARESMDFGYRLVIAES